MRSLRVVVTALLFNDDLSLLEAAEDFAVEQFIPESGVETFAAAFLQGEPGSRYVALAPTASIQSSPV